MFVEKYCLILTRISVRYVENFCKIFVKKYFLVSYRVIQRCFRLFKVAVIPDIINFRDRYVWKVFLSRGHRIEAPVWRGVLLFQPGLKQEFLAVKFLLPGSRIFTDSEHDRVKYKFPFYSAAISRGRGSTGGRAMRHKTRHTPHQPACVGIVKRWIAPGFRFSPSRLDGVLIKRGHGNEIQIGFRLDSRIR